MRHESKRNASKIHSRLAPHASRLLRSARVAHLATADARGRPHVVPICFVMDGEKLFTPLDAKPKKRAPLNLQRVRNIVANPHVAVVVDRYDEDWRRLAYVLLRGKAKLLHRGSLHAKAIRASKAKYSQYRAMDIDRSPVIMITVEHSYIWIANVAKFRKRLLVLNNKKEF